MFFSQYYIWGMRETNLVGCCRHHLFSVNTAILSSVVLNARISQLLLHKDSFAAVESIHILPADLIRESIELRPKGHRIVSEHPLQGRPLQLIHPTHVLHHDSFGAMIHS